MSRIEQFPLLLFVSAATLILVGCSAQSSGKYADADTAIKYSIEDQNITPGIKRSLDVRLYQKASEAELGKLAVTLKNLDGNQYQRTFIHYYLPGMTIGEGAWARSDFDPELEVQIFGLSIDDDEAIDREDSTIPGEILGRWSDEKVGFPACYTLFHENGKTYLKTTFKDASNTIFEVVEKPSGVGKRYEELEPKHGEYFLLDASGTLKRGDTRGIWLTMQPAKRPLRRQTDLASSSTPKEPHDPQDTNESGKPLSTEELVVSMTVEPKVGADKRAIIFGKTNLPADTELVVTVEDAVSPDRAYQTKASVLADGTYQSEALGQLSGLEDGWYVASVTMPYAMTQPEHVRQAIGKNGDNLTGPLVEKNDTFGATISVETKFLVGGSDAVPNQAARLKEEVADIKEIAQQIKELFSRLEETKSKGLFDESKYSVFQIGDTFREISSKHKSLSDRVDTLGRTPAALTLRWPLGQLMAMLLSAKNEKENEYREARSEYLNDFKELEDFISEREVKLSAGSVDFAADSGSGESRATTALEGSEPKSVEDEGFRTWTSASGKFSTEAKMVSFANGVVTLENRKGKQIKVNIEKLSDTDHGFVAKWRSQSR